jgi:hypothetical protein
LDFELLVHGLEPLRQDLDLFVQSVVLAVVALWLGTLALLLLAGLSLA